MLKDQIVFQIKSDKESLACALIKIETENGKYYRSINFVPKSSGIPLYYHFLKKGKEIAKVLL